MSQSADCDYPIAKKRGLWKPLLSGQDASNAWQIIEAIAGELTCGCCDHPESADCYLVDGLSGISLFFAYRSLALSSDMRADPIVGQSILAAVRGAWGEHRHFGLMTGLAGVAWVAQHVNHPDTSSALDSFDSGLLEILRARQPWKYCMGLFEGLVGLALYALERPQTDVIIESLEVIASSLLDTASRDADGTYWANAPSVNKWRRRDDSDNDVLVDLGMAQGMASIVAILARLVSAGVRTTDLRPLLTEATAWFLKRAVESHGSRWFPSAWGDNVSDSLPGAAWCYGDAGAIAAMSLASCTMTDPSLGRLVVSHARDVAHRRISREPLVNACLCHGTGGVAHVLGRVWQRTGDEQVREGALRWLRHTMDLRDVKGGIAGFMFDWLGKAKPMPGLLRGVAGLGLILLGAVSDVEPAWDRVVLLS